MYVCLIYPDQSTKDLLYPKKIYTISKCNSIKLNSFCQVLYSFYIFECFAVWNINKNFTGLYDVKDYVLFSHKYINIISSNANFTIIFAKYQEIHNIFLQYSVELCNNLNFIGGFLQSQLSYLNILRMGIKFAFFCNIVLNFVLALTPAEHIEICFSYNDLSIKIAFLISVNTQLIFCKSFNSLLNV